MQIAQCKRFLIFNHKFHVIVCVMNSQNYVQILPGLRKHIDGICQMLHSNNWKPCYKALVVDL